MRGQMIEVLKHTVLGYARWPDTIVRTPDRACMGHSLLYFKFSVWPRAPFVPHLTDANWQKKNIQTCRLLQMRYDSEHGTFGSHYSWVEVQPLHNF